MVGHEGASELVQALSTETESKFAQQPAWMVSRALGVDTWSPSRSRYDNTHMTSLATVLKPGRVCGTFRHGYARLQHVADPRVGLQQCETTKDVFTAARESRRDGKAFVLHSPRSSPAATVRNSSGARRDEIFSPMRRCVKVPR